MIFGQLILLVLLDNFAQQVLWLNILTVVVFLLMPLSMYFAVKAVNTHEYGSNRSKIEVIFGWAILFIMLQMILVIKSSFVDSNSLYWEQKERIYNDFKQE